MDQICEKAKWKEKYIPEEIFFDIVSRLPSKCVGRFTTVSKSWYAFIKSSAFITAHLKQSIANDKGDSTHYLLYMSATAEDYEYCSAYRDNIESFDKVFYLKLPMDFEWGSCTPIGSCNGLVCLTKEDLYGCVIYLWNPLIRKYKCITGTSCCSTMFNDECTEVSVGFWYDDGIHDYKLIRIMHNERNNSIEFANRSQVELYSLNVGSWRKSHAKLPGRIETGNFYNQAFLNGTFNWISYCPSRSDNYGLFMMISSFDTNTEKFRKVEFPKHVYPIGCSLVAFYLGVHKGCLALLVGLGNGDSWSVWVMNEFGEVESWVKKFTLVTKENIYRPIGVTQNDEIIFCCEEEIVMAYNLETDVIRFLPCDGSVHPWWFNYTESLVFLDVETELFEGSTSFPGTSE